MSSKRPLRDQLQTLREQERVLREQHDALKAEEQDLRSQRILAAEQLAGVQKEIRKVRQSIARNPDDTAHIEVSDRAIVEYLRDVKGFPVEQIREEIIEAVADGPEKVMSISTSTVEVKNRTMLVRDGRVVGILDPTIASRKGS